MFKRLTPLTVTSLLNTTHVRFSLHILQIAYIDYNDSKISVKSVKI